jgi:hypothetical protein
VVRIWLLISTPGGCSVEVEYGIRETRVRGDRYHVRRLWWDPQADPGCDG